MTRRQQEKAIAGEPFHAAGLLDHHMENPDLVYRAENGGKSSICHTPGSEILIDKPLPDSEDRLIHGVRCKLPQ